MSNLKKLKESGVKFYVVILDDSCHQLLVPHDQVDTVNKLLEKDYDDRTDEDTALLDSFYTLEGEGYYVVLEED